jgi:hypothetical protein
MLTLSLVSWMELDAVGTTINSNPIGVLRATIKMLKINSCLEACIDCDVPAHTLSCFPLLFICQTGVADWRLVREPLGQDSIQLPSFPLVNNKHLNCAPLQESYNLEVRNFKIDSREPCQLSPPFSFCLLLHHSATPRPRVIHFC